MYQCIAIQVDYEKLANYAGMTNPRSASNAWAKIRTKLNTATGDGASTTPKKTPKKKAAAPAAAAEKTDDDGSGDAPESTYYRRILWLDHRCTDSYQLLRSRPLASASRRSRRSMARQRHPRSVVALLAQRPRRPPTRRSPVRDLSPRPL
jgi:hypothetical protein